MPVRRPLPAILLINLLVACVCVAAQEPERARQAYERAVALEAEGNHAAALSLLWEASGLAPRDADIQNRLGEALERIGALDVAVDAFRNALALRPTFRSASNNLILALVKVGKGPEAVARADAQPKPRSSTGYPVARISVASTGYPVARISVASTGYPVARISQWPPPDLR